MNPLLLAAYVVLKDRGHADWTVEEAEIAADCSPRPSRQLLLISSKLRDVGAVLKAVLHVNLDTQHPGWEAQCDGCGRWYFRSKPAAAEHYCLACGPVAGRLSYG